METLGVLCTDSNLAGPVEAGLLVSLQEVLDEVKKLKSSLHKLHLCLFCGARIGAHVLAQARQVLYLTAPSVPSAPFVANICLHVKCGHPQWVYLFYTAVRWLHKALGFDHWSV
jgi:hypothetical protein